MPPSSGSAAATAPVTRSDFGGIVQGVALGVLEPQTTEEVEQIVLCARRERSKITLRGLGMSQSGQSVPNHSLLVSLGRLDRIERPSRSAESVVCGAGATFRNVLATCAAQGLVPKVLPLNLDLSVGGVMSAGGFGSTSHRSGPAVAQVVVADVVLGSGVRVETGPAHERSVYDAVFGGVGRSGIITRVELRCEPLPVSLRTFYLLYEDLEHLVQDATKLGSRATHLEAFCSASVQGLCRAPDGGRRPLVHWLFGLHVSVACDDPEHPAASQVLEGLRFEKLLHDDADDPVAFAARYELRFESMRTTGAWQQAHPWFEAILPASRAVEFIERALRLLPAFFGDGHRIMFLAPTDRPRALAFPEHPAVGFAVLPQAIPEPYLPAALEVLRKLDTMVTDAGGKRYLSGYQFDMDAAAWRRHYQEDYEVLVRAKHEYDPEDIFCSRLPPLSGQRAPRGGS